MRTPVIIRLQRLLPRRALTRLIYRLTRIENRFVKNATIAAFIRAYGVDVSDAANDVPNGYRTFNDFFTRALQPGARTVDEDASAIVSPVDGRVSEIGAVDKDRILQAKGLHYGLTELVGGDASLSERFADGAFATIYLAPHNYHRVHMPVDGTLVRHATVGTDLYSVNDITAAHVPGLFTVNERHIALFDTGLGPLGLIFVGALNVGSITTVWGGETRAGRRQNGVVHWEPGELSLARGELAGWFNLGSTVIVLAGPGRVGWEPAIARGTVVRMGQRIGTAYPPRE